MVRLRHCKAQFIAVWFLKKYTNFVMIYEPKKSKCEIKLKAIFTSNIVGAQTLRCSQVHCGSCWDWFLFSYQGLSQES